MLLRHLLPALLFLLIAVVNAGSAPLAATPGNKPAATAPQPSAGDVALDGVPVLTITTGLFSLTPAERAKVVSRRLEKLANNPFAAVQSIRLDDGETTTDIVIDDQIIMTVTEHDAADKGVARLALAKDYAERIKAAVIARKEQYSARSILTGSLKAAGATLVLLVFLTLLNRFVAHLSEKIVIWKGSRISSIRFQSIEILHEDRIVAALLSMLRFMRLFLVLGLLYLYIPLTLSFFPWTAGVSETLLNYIETPLVKIWHATISYLPNIFFVAVVVVLTHYFLRFIKFLFGELEKEKVILPGFYPDWANPSYKIARFLIIAFAVVVAFPYLPGSNSPAFKGVSVFLGVLFSLGSTSAISNIVAGVILTYTRAFTLGDRVKIADTVGDVVEKTLLVTRIRSIKNVDITVPNSMVLGSHIINYSSSAQQIGLILNPAITLGYEVPWRRAHELLIAAARATDRILSDPAPFVLQTAMNDFNVSYELNAYTALPCSMANIYSELHGNILDKFNEAGIEIMSPHHTSLRDGNMTAIPPEYLPKDYQPAAHLIRRV